MTRVRAGVAVCGIMLAAIGPWRAVAVETSLPAGDTAVTRWERDVAALEALDRRQADPPDAILFIGSSSIRLWDSIAADMAPWPVVRRGYGGARYRDLCHYAPRLVARHDPRAIVVFVANDITDPESAPTVEQVMVDVRATLEGIRGQHPRVPVLFVAVTPTAARWAMWPEVSRLNAAIDAMCAEKERTFFIATAERFLEPDTGRPAAVLFREDRLHLSPAGYAVWAEEIAAALTEVLDEVAVKAVPRAGSGQEADGAPGPGRSPR